MSPQDKTILLICNIFTYLSVYKNELIKKKTVRTLFTFIHLSSGPNSEIQGLTFFVQHTADNYTDS